MPRLEYTFKDGYLFYRWGNSVSDFDMPVDIFMSGEEIRIHPTTEWQEMNTFANDLTIDPDVYVGSMNVLGN